MAKIFVINFISMDAIILEIDNDSRSQSVGQFDCCEYVFYSDPRKHIRILHRNKTVYPI